MDVGGTPGIGMMAPGIGAGLDADETVAPLPIGHRAALAAKIRIEGSWVLVVFVNIPACRVRLPNLDEGIRDRAPLLIGHAARHDDALAEPLPQVLLGEVGVVVAKSVVPEDGPREFGERWRDDDQRPGWRGDSCRPVIRGKIGWMSSQPFKIVQAGHSSLLFSAKFSNAALPVLRK